VGFTYLDSRLKVVLTYPGREEAEACLLQDDEVRVRPVGKTALARGYPQGAGGVEGGGLQGLHSAAAGRLKELEDAFVHGGHRAGQGVCSCVVRYVLKTNHLFLNWSQLEFETDGLNSKGICIHNIPNIHR
jgi:hypothetical protein